MFIEQVVSADHLFQGVRGEGVDAGQISDSDIGMSFQFAFLLFYCNARPVAHILVGSGHGVEHGGFAAVWVAHQCHANGHDCFLLLISLC